MPSKSNAGKIWDVSDYQLREAMLRQHYQSEYSVKKFITRTWFRLPESFKKHMIMRYR